MRGNAASNWFSCVSFNIINVVTVFFPAVVLLLKIIWVLFGIIESRVAEPEPPGAGLFGWSRKNYKVSAPAPAPAPSEL